MTRVLAKFVICLMLATSQQVCYAENSQNVLDAKKQQIFIDATAHNKKSAELERIDKTRALQECDQAIDGYSSLNASIATLSPATCVSIYTPQIECWKRYVSIELSQEDPSESRLPMFYVLSASNYGTISQLYYDRSVAYSRMNQTALSAEDLKSSALWKVKAAQREALGFSKEDPGHAGHILYQKGLYAQARPLLQAGLKNTAKADREGGIERIKQELADIDRILKH